MGADIISIKANLSSSSTELANWNWAWQKGRFNGKCVKNATKVLQFRRGLRDTQEINTNTYKKLWKMWQYFYKADLDQETLMKWTLVLTMVKSRKPHQKTSSKWPTNTWRWWRRLYYWRPEKWECKSKKRKTECEVKKKAGKWIWKNVTKFLKGRPGLRDTQVRNTNTPLSCLQEVQEAAKEETQHHREGGGESPCHFSINN